MKHPFLSIAFVVGTTSTLTLLIVFVLLGGPMGCAARQRTPSPATAVDWDLSPRAEQTFQYLKFLDRQKARDYIQATSALERALAIAPSPGLYKELANLHWRARNIDAARDILKKAMGIYPHDRDFYLLLAQSYIVVGRLDDAVTTLEDCLRIAPGDVAVVLELAAVQIEIRRFAQAMDALESIPFEQRDAQANFLLGKAASALGLKKQAVAYLELAVQEDPEFLQAWVEMAYLFETQKDYVRAETIYDQILAQGQGGRDILIRLIALNLRLNNPDKALELVDIDDDGQFRLQAAHEFMQQEFFEQAGDILAELAARDEPPADIALYLALWAWEGYGDADRAIEYLERLPADSPRARQADSFRIQLLFGNNRREEALGLSWKSMETYPDDSHFVLQSSTILERMGRLDEALAVLASGEKQWPEDTDILFALGSMQDRAGNKVLALEYMERIIRLDSNHADALNYLGYTLADAGQDLDRALILIQGAVKIEPTNGYYIDSLAWVYYRMGNLDQAWIEIQRAVEQVEDDPVIWEHYAEIAERIGDRPKALQATERVWELKAESDPEKEPQVDPTQP
ncbi:MAG: tetratricopeptide repeat protein [Deltaproteobacteria bacterium]|nr:tetratricopeptide repeat protein [Deltaproteobacteria bacterium]